MAEEWPTSGIDLHLELDAGTGRRAGLEQALRAAIQAGRLPPDARLPATRRLAADLGLSRGTVRAAYDQLIAEGYLTARHGSGTVVARIPQRRTRLAEEQPERPRHDLRPGSPDVTAFPATAWLRSARRALLGAPGEIFGYGDPRGRIELRTALAGYLGRARGVLAEPAQIVVVNGYAQALALLVGALDGRRIAMEDPGTPYHRQVVAACGASVVPLPVDSRGARTDLLPNLEVHAVEVTPAHQYPTGRTLHPQRRRSLVSWARESGGLVIENDFDGEFRYDRQPVGAVQGTAPDHVAYVGTASKTLAPGLRLAWMVVPPGLVEPVVEAKHLADRHTESLGQLTLADLVDTHAYDRHIRACRLRYQRRRDLLERRLRPFAARLRVQGVAAGLQTLVGLPEGGPTEAEVVAAAAADGLVLAGLDERWHSPGDHPQGLVVGFARPPEHAYPAALDALVDTLSPLLG